MRAYVRQLINRPNSPRHDNERISFALTFAEEDKISQTCDYHRLARREGKITIEVIQKVKDQLQSIIKTSPIVIDASKQFALPPDYYYDLGFEVLYNGNWVNVTPTTVNQTLGGRENIYERATIEEMEYNVFSNTGFLINGETTNLSNITQGRMTYVRKTQGIFIDDKANLVPPATDLPIGNEYGVDSGTVTYNGTVYTKNQSFIIITGFLQFTGTGNVLLVKSSELDYQAHKDLCKAGAKILADTVENFEKGKNLEVELMKE